MAKGVMPPWMKGKMEKEKDPKKSKPAGKRKAVKGGDNAGPRQMVTRGD